MVAPSSFLHMDWEDAPWVKMCRLSNSFYNQDGTATLTMEEKRKKIDELMATAVDEGAAYMKQTPNHLLDGAEDAMRTQYSHLPDYGLFTEAEAEALFEKKLEQIRNNPKGMMEFYKPSFDAWGNPAYVVAFYVAIQQKLLRADQVVYDVSLYYTSKQFSAPVDSDDEDEDEEEEHVVQNGVCLTCEKKKAEETAELRLAAAPAATTGTEAEAEAEDRFRLAAGIGAYLYAATVGAGQRADNEKKDYPTISERDEYLKTIYDQQLEIQKLRLEAAEMRLAAAPAATTGTVVNQEVAAPAAKKQKKN